MSLSNFPLLNKTITFLTEISAASGTATLGTDFTALTQIVFNANDAEAYGDVALINNGDVESTETFTLTIVANQQDVAIGSTGTTTVSITDDDSKSCLVPGA